jgi:hypothetical protein
MYAVTGCSVCGVQVVDQPSGNDPTWQVYPGVSQDTQTGPAA